MRVYVIGNDSDAEFILVYSTLEAAVRVLRKLDDANFDMWEFAQPDTVNYEEVLAEARKNESKGETYLFGTEYDRNNFFITVAMMDEEDIF